MRMGWLICDTQESNTINACTIMFHLHLDIDSPESSGIYFQKEKNHNNIQQSCHNELLSRNVQCRKYAFFRTFWRFEGNRDLKSSKALKCVLIWSSFCSKLLKRPQFSHWKLLRPSPQNKIPFTKALKLSCHSLVLLESRIMQNLELWYYLAARLDNSRYLYIER